VMEVGFGVLSENSPGETKKRMDNLSENLARLSTFQVFNLYCH